MNSVRVDLEIIHARMCNIGNMKKIPAWWQKVKTHEEIVKIYFSFVINWQIRFSANPAPSFS